MTERCEMCKSKLLLSDFACRCAKRYCQKHRMPEQHSCTFDFKKEGKEQLSTILVKVIAEKIDHI